MSKSVAFERLSSVQTSASSKHRVLSTDTASTSLCTAFATVSPSMAEEQSVHLKTGRVTSQKAPATVAVKFPRLLLRFPVGVTQHVALLEESVTIPTFRRPSRSDDKALRCGQ
ncbi:hypothetical protein BT67DRAFT_438550 [Trichocladium antarcticum]|uniref:Uncharacterized protein n=1 Tax=Trichocladium antarcticum TaxID=1450529 RepID=A0AAN6UQV4_9PEZI|nr:hypothetical protein BT67DRAFT_438550 [Trichocladium antarcticum]